ncbi:MAG: FAD-binding domain [Hyphomicrobiaceae bacterium]
MTGQTVLISGIGIAGPALAYWLRRAGMQPTLIEHAPTLRTGGYVIDFWGLGYDIAEQMGLIPDLERRGYRVGELRIVDRDGQRVTGFGTDVFRELTGGRYLSLRRSDLGALLFEKARPGTDVIFGDEITALEQEADGVRVRFSKAPARRFDLVIGADGLHSRVRELVFGPQHRFEYPLGYVVAAFDTVGYRPRDENVYIMHNTPGRMLARFTMRDDQALFLLVVAAGPAGLPAAHDVAAQKAFLREQFATAGWEAWHILDELARTDDLYFDRVSQIRMDRWSDRRVALVGDAAFCVSLLAGQGSALAMTAAYVLAGELAKAGRDHAKAFRSYEQILRGYIETKQKGAEQFGGAFAPKTGWGLFVRDLVIRATAIPGVAKLTFGRDLIDKLKLPAYSWPPEAGS